MTDFYEDDESPEDIWAAFQSSWIECEGWTIGPPAQPATSSTAQTYWLQMIAVP